MKSELHRMASNIFNICIQSGIYLEVQWIPRTLNQQADYISRLLDTDDWQITDDLFLSLDARWGPHTVDCFANYYNHKPDYSMHIGNQSLVHGRNPNSLLGSEHFKGYIIALRMEFID